MLTLVKRPGSPYWIARGTINGRRIERSTKESSKADARIILKEILAELTGDQIGPSGLRFDQALAMYLTEKPDAKIRPAIVQYFGDMAVKDINLSEMRRAANKLFPKATPATVARQLFTPIKAILNNAAAEELCAAPKFRSPKGGKKRTVFMVPDQAEALITAMAAHPHRHFAVLVTFLFGQGSRMGETLALDWRDVSLEHRFAILRDTKTDAERRLTLIDRTVAALSTIRPEVPRGPVFTRSDGNPFRTGHGEGGQIKYQWKDAAEAAGIDPKIYTPHVCRHSWATWFYAQTHDVLRLRDEGGWTSQEWQRYTKLGTPELGDDARKSGWEFDAVGEKRGKGENYAAISMRRSPV